MTPSRDISRLLEIMAALRTPGTGCPWDLEQDFATIAPYTIEEAYEVTDAIARGDLDDLREELGDLLLQVVFHARMAEEQNAFAFGDVVEAITRKMIRRHPHVFADKDGRLTPGHVTRSLGPHQGRGKGRTRRAASRRGSRAQIAAVGRESRATRADARHGPAAQGLQRRLRLERSARGAAQDPRGSRRDRGRARPRRRAGTRRAKPAISCSRWSIWRATSAPIRRPRWAAPTPNSNAGLPISSAPWPRRAVRWKTPRSPRWTRCGTRRRPKNRIRRRPQPGPKGIIAGESSGHSRRIAGGRHRRACVRLSRNHQRRNSGSPAGAHSGKDQHVAQGISLVAQVVPTSLSGVRNYSQSGHRISLRWLIWLAFGFGVGGCIGALLATHVSDRALQWSFVGYLTILLAIVVLRPPRPKVEGSADIADDVPLHWARWPRSAPSPAGRPDSSASAVDWPSPR